MKMIKVLVVSVLSISLAACFEERWTGSICEDRSKMGECQIIGMYTSVDGCKAAAELELSKVSNKTKGTFECGRDCRPMFSDHDLTPGTTSVMVCKENKQW